MRTYRIYLDLRASEVGHVDVEADTSTKSGCEAFFYHKNGAICSFNRDHIVAILDMGEIKEGGK